MVVEFIPTARYVNSLVSVATWYKICHSWCYSLTSGVVSEPWQCVFLIVAYLETATICDWSNWSYRPIYKTEDSMRCWTSWFGTSFSSVMSYSLQSLAPFELSLSTSQLFARWRPKPWLVSIRAGWDSDRFTLCLNRNFVYFLNLIGHQYCCSLCVI